MYGLPKSVRIELRGKGNKFGVLEGPGRPYIIMGPWDFEGDGLVVGIKPIGPNVISDGFEMFKWFPSGFDFVISFQWIRNWRFLR